VFKVVGLDIIKEATPLKLDINMASHQQRLETFLSRAKEKCGDQYDYPDINYTHVHGPITINCPTHGSFIRTSISHLRLCYGPRKNTLMFTDAQTATRK
jgi:hypothetical protein